MYANSLMVRSVQILRLRPFVYQSRRTRVTSLSAPSNDAADQQRMKWQTNYDTLMKASTLSLAPMMEYTDRHFRKLVRLISNRTLVYSEMVASNALAHERQIHMEAYQDQYPWASIEEVRQNYDDNYIQRYLVQSPDEGPSVLQLGGSDPQQLYGAAQAVLEMSRRPGRNCQYTALNLNCGCPSSKVAGKGSFGAALMDEPKLVAKLTRAMHEGCEGEMPITVKCRIGTDSKRPFSKPNYMEMDSEQEYRELCTFIETIAADGIVTDFCVHARIAVLSKSYSPAENRKIPPLKYDLVRRLVQDYPELTFSLNGGLETISQVQTELAAAPGLRGVMIGRAWAADPWSFAMADQLLYGDRQPAAVNRWELLQQYATYADAEEAIWGPLLIRRFLCKAITPLFAGEPNAKRYRIALEEISGMPKKMQNDLQRLPPLSELILEAATSYLSSESLLRTPLESYERILWEERKVGDGRSQSVLEWQAERAGSA